MPRKSAMARIISTSSSIWLQFCRWQIFSFLGHLHSPRDANHSVNGILNLICDWSSSSNWADWSIERLFSTWKVPSSGVNNQGSSSSITMRCSIITYLLNNKGLYILYRLLVAWEAFLKKAIIFGIPFFCRFGLGRWVLNECRLGRL